MPPYVYKVGNEAHTGLPAPVGVTDVRVNVSNAGPGPMGGKAGEG